MNFIRNLKKKALNHLKNNYIGIIAVVFLLAFFTFEYKSNLNFIYKNNTLVTHTISNLDYILPNIRLAEPIKDFFNLSTNCFTYLFKLFGSLKSFCLSNIGMGIILALSFLIEVIYNILFCGPFRVGVREYLLKNNRRTRFGILFKYFKTNYTNVMKTMAYMFIYQTLWNFTIIGGFIKHYEYKFIPYILAENPDMKKDEVFALSKKLSTNYKLTMFKIDLTFVILFVLNIFTFGLLGILFASPYHILTEKELYIELTSTN